MPKIQPIQSETQSVRPTRALIVFETNSLLRKEFKLCCVSNRKTMRRVLNEAMIGFLKKNKEK